MAPTVCGTEEIVYVPVRDPAVERSIVPTSMTLVIRSDAPPASLTLEPARGPVEFLVVERIEPPTPN